MRYSQEDRGSNFSKSPLGSPRASEMDSNKDEAERCLEYANHFIFEKNYVKAEKFLRKAQKLYPSKKVEELLEQITLHMKETRVPDAKSEGVRKRHVTVQEEVYSQTTNDITKEQIESVKRIKKCKDYYEILGVTKEATDSEVKKAYKKLALQLHPDKNKAPGAAEAFKAIGNAVAVLTDAEKRKQYDMYGSQEQRLGAAHARQAHADYSYTRGFEADMTAEELFNMFFSGGFPQQGLYSRRAAGVWTRQRDPQMQHSHSQQTNDYTACLQMLPVLLLIVLTMMSSFFISDPMYSLQSNAKYSVPRTTQGLKVPYYVKENFHSEYQGSLRRLEISVEEEYVNTLRHNCYREKNYKDTILWKARNFRDQDLYEKGKSMETPSCKKLVDLHAA
ncbi:dnaJ homolog subfamily B member 12 [Orussus abietinus]|uniref:dnaJ homolog subfamily B member 12 n=1 Tax=Orussus abietinus TaxID=222816 RepID=UPI00062526F4|nr:dnaJ homolog subfamily B member 12 [Orussus abietinus]